MVQRNIDTDIYTIDTGCVQKIHQKGGEGGRGGWN